jgi:hypothetical protein
MLKNSYPVVAQMNWLKNLALKVRVGLALDPVNVTRGPKSLDGRFVGSSLILFM